MGLYLKQKAPRSVRSATYLNWLLGQNQTSFTSTWDGQNVSYVVDPAGAAIAFSIAPDGTITYGSGNCSTWGSSSLKQFANAVLGLAS